MGDSMNYKGLSIEEVNIRKEKGLVNYDTTIKTKSINLIILLNIFTLFNILNFFLAILVFIYGNIKNLLFIGVVISNTLISIIQEIRTKKAIDKLSIISCIKVDAIRDGKKQKININQIVKDDILVLEIGNQVVVDSIILEGEVEVNESYITGESNSILKTKDDKILSGSFIVSGKCYVKVIHVGEENYTNKISKEAKYIKKNNSEILNSLNKIIKFVSIIIIPFGILMFFKQLSLVNINNSVINTVAAIIGMIPEGLVLLTSTTLAVSAFNLTKENVLVQNLYSIESLARVDTLCLDKTGTLTTGELEIVDVINIKHVDYQEILSNYCKLVTTSNITMDALLKKFKNKVSYEKIEEIPFSSSRKYSAITFKNKGTYILGAPDVLLTKDELKKYEYIFDDNRILVLCHSNESIKNNSIPTKYEVCSFIVLKDKLRKNVSKIIKYFYKQGVDIKIISGDSIKTIEGVTKQVGIKGNSINVREDRKYLSKVNDYSIFSRVDPIEKQKIIKKLKENHVVAYIGDGVNDVLALKEADSSIALKNGSEATRSVSNIVILDSDFGHLVEVLKEGRRTINNITRSASLFLSKTIYSSLLLIMFLLVSFSYPFIPIHITLISVFAIGLPAFLLTFEPNTNIVEGDFIKNILKNSFPTAFTIFVEIIFVSIVTYFKGYDSLTMSTISIIVTAFSSFQLLFDICRPLNKFRILLIISMFLCFMIGFIIFRNLFSLAIINKDIFDVILVLILLSLLIYRLSVKLFDFIYKKYKKY